jgi:hypothetical protein
LLLLLRQPCGLGPPLLLFRLPRRFGVAID